MVELSVGAVGASVPERERRAVLPVPPRQGRGPARPAGRVLGQPARRGARRRHRGHHPAAAGGHGRKRPGRSWRPPSGSTPVGQPSGRARSGCRRRVARRPVLMPSGPGGRNDPAGALPPRRSRVVDTSPVYDRDWGEDAMVVPSQVSSPRNEGGSTRRRPARRTARDPPTSRWSPGVRCTSCTGRRAGSRCGNRAPRADAVAGRAPRDRRGGEMTCRSAPTAGAPRSTDACGAGPCARPATSRSWCSWWRSWSSRPASSFPS